MELKLKDQTIDTLQKSLQELREIIKSSEDQERQRVHDHNLKLELILEGNAKLINAMRDLTNLGNEKKLSLNELLCNVDSVSKQNRILLENEDMVLKKLDQIKTTNVVGQENDSRSNTWNRSMNFLATL